MDKKRRMIYLNEALRELEKRCDAAERLRAEAETEERRSRLEAVAMAFIEAGMTLKDLQAVEERPCGRWTVEDCHAATYKYCCSNCGAHHRALYDYCPTCGAFMENNE